MRPRELRVLICGDPVGTVWQDDFGSYHFAYDGDYSGAPVSLSMPLTCREYDQKAVLPFLFGLLPDSEAQRVAIAREYGISPNNPIAMLSHIGLDCPGGIQFCELGGEGAVASRSREYVELSDHEIAQRLKSIRDERESSWMGRAESWSLGGNQGKFALALRDGVWCECRCAAPTSHIFKYGVAGFELEALNEFVCMKTAERSGVPAAKVSYRYFEDEPALIVKRFDRMEGKDGAVYRLHQEDLCQALGVMPSQKYTADGGPTTTDVLTLLGQTERCGLNLMLFTEMLFFNCLIGAPDAHAKNYSLVINDSGEAMMAPLYDCASGLAYEQMRRHGRLAMSIGGENRFGRVGAGALERYVTAADFVGHGLQSNSHEAVMRSLAYEIPVSLAEVFDEYADIPGISELRGHMERPIVENCERTLALL